MAGSPLKRAKKAAIMRYLQKRASENECDVIECVEEYLASGGTIAALARDIGAQENITLSREFLSKTLHNLTDDAKTRIREAQRDGAQALVEEVSEIADAATEDDVQVARLRVDTKKWVATVLDPSLAPNRQGGVNVNINLGQLHLDALRQRAAARVIAVAEVPALVKGEDAEIVE